MYVISWFERIGRLRRLKTVSRAVASGVKGGDNSRGPHCPGAPQNPGIILYRPMFCE